MSTLTLKELSAPTGEVIKIAAGKTLDLKSQGSVTMPTGSVLQVLTNKGSAGLSLTSQTFVTTGMSVTITPSSTSSKILAMFTCKSVTTLAANTAINVHLRRSGTDVSVVNYYTAQQGGNQTVPVGTMHTLDSPNTTSAITYEVFVQEGGIAGTVQINGPLELTLMEIAG